MMLHVLSIPNSVEIVFVFELKMKFRPRRLYGLRAAGTSFDMHPLAPPFSC